MRSPERGPRYSRTESRGPIPGTTKKNSPRGSFSLYRHSNWNDILLAPTFCVGVPGTEHDAPPFGRAFAFALSWNGVGSPVYPDVFYRGLPRLVPMLLIWTLFVGVPGTPGIPFDADAPVQQSQLRSILTILCAEPKYHLLRFVL